MATSKRLSCDICSMAKRTCDRAKPSCRRCTRLLIQCSYKPDSLPSAGRVERAKLSRQKYSQEQRSKVAIVRSVGARLRYRVLKKPVSPRHLLPTQADNLRGVTSVSTAQAVPPVRCSKRIVVFACGRSSQTCDMTSWVRNFSATSGEH